MAQSKEYLELLEKARARVPELIDEMRDLHIRKANGYSGSDNPDTWQNFRNSERLGVEAWRGALVRELDKTQRLLNILAQPDDEQLGETVEDTAMDRAAYNLIFICLWREKHPRTVAEPEIAPI